MRLGGPDCRPLVAHGAGRFHHQAPECDNRDVACADTLPGAVADRAHRLPHRDILVRYAADAGEIALLHRRTVLTIEVAARAHAIEIVINVDAPLQNVELAPGIGVDAGLVRTVPGDEIKD